MVEEIRNIQREVLPNGLTILTEHMNHIRSVSMGIWVKTGSRHEDPTVNGSSPSSDNIKVLDEHLPIAVDVLSDMVLHPVFDANEIMRERGVILEEIKMDEDNPDYLVHEIFTQNFFKDHPLGKPILGTKETVRRFDQDAIHGFYPAKFAPGNLIISAAGNVNHEEFVELLRHGFGQLPAGSNGWHDSPPKMHSRIILRNKKSLEQVQICVGVPSYRISDERRYVSYI